MSSQPPLACWSVDFQITTLNKVPALRELSSPAERIIAACDDDLFSVRNIYKLPRNTRGAVEEQIRDSDSIFSDYGQHRLMAVLDALASLLVSQPRGEVVAVGFVPSKDDRVALCIGENGSPDKSAAAENHLRQIWAILKALRATADQTERQKKPEENAMPRDLTLHLYQLCYTFSRDRMKWHYDKAVKFGMHDALINVKANKEARDQQDQAPEPPNPTKGRRPFPKADPDFELMSEAGWQLVDALIKVFEAYPSYALKSGDPLDLLESCSRANDVVRLLKGELCFLDRILPKYALEPFNHPDGDRFQRMTEKLLTIHTSIRQVLLLLGSVSCSYILDRSELLILRAESLVSYINYDFKQDARIQKLLMDTKNMSYDKFLSEMTVRKRARRDEFALSIHAECAVLSYFISKRIHAYPYIGVSRLSCVGCWYFFAAYNDAACASGLPILYTRIA